MEESAIRKLDEAILALQNAKIVMPEPVNMFTKVSAIQITDIIKKHLTVDADTLIQIAVYLVGAEDGDISDVIRDFVNVEENPNLEYVISAILDEVESADNIRTTQDMDVVMYDW